MKRVTEAPWETRHAAWVRAGNRCEQCEAEHERGFHGPSARERWQALLVDCACWWDGTVLPVLRRWALFPRGGDGTWDFYPDGRTPRAVVEAGELAELGKAQRYRVAAVAAELALEGDAMRGPVQSRPDWEAQLAAHDARARAAWTGWADALFGASCGVPNITANADIAVQRTGVSVTI